MSRKRYSKQFKLDAVRLVTEQGYSVNRAGEAVGVCHTTIAEWVRRFGEQSAPRTEFASAKDELDHLRAENRRLRMERDILKKAAVYFATEEGS